MISTVTSCKKRTGDKASIQVTTSLVKFESLGTRLRLLLAFVSEIAWPFCLKDLSHRICQLSISEESQTIPNLFWHLSSLALHVAVQQGNSAMGTLND